MDSIQKIYNGISSCAKTNLYAIAFAVYLLVIFFYMTNKPDILYSEQYFYFSIIIIPFVALCFWIYKNFIDIQNATISSYSFLFIVSMLLLVCVGIYLYISGEVSILEIRAAFTSFRVIEALIAFVILAIIFKTMIKKIDTTDSGGWSGFFVQLLFYIPCLISDFVEYLLGEFKSTPNVVFSLFIIEIILILLYIYLPKLATASIMKNGTIIVKDPTPINVKKPFKTYVDLTNTDSKKNNSQQIIKNTFAISGWVYIVSQPPNKYPYNEEATIFEFTTQHPRLVFNGKTNTFKAYLNETQSHEFAMPLQKWNNVVFNYDRFNIDLFVNGELIHSAKRNLKDDNFQVNDLIYIGQDRGLSGGVCNLFYSTTPLIGEDIKHNYNYNKYNEPPV